MAYVLAVTGPTLLVILLLLYCRYFVVVPTVPLMDTKAWWGPEELKGKKDESIRPFKIEFSEDMIKDLRYRLENTRSLTPPLEATFQYGFNTKAIQSWLEYWARDYNFTRREEEMNRYPQFKTNVNGLDIHFIRVKPEVPPGVEVVPLLALHGWPGSVLEFFGVIPHLTNVSEGRDFAVEVIAASLPGFGYSDGAVRPGLAAPEIATVLRNLMKRLGHEKFYLQGGDWGGIICNLMATLFPEDILGFHTNFAFPATLKVPILLGIQSFFSKYRSEKTSEDQKHQVDSLKKRFYFLLEESGYFHQLATKPDTIGISISDSPAGLLAYILEKFSTGTDPQYRMLPDGGLDRQFTREQLLDNLMMYWVPNTFITSGRLYAESVSKRVIDMKLDDIPSEVPTWIIQAKHEIINLPTSILKVKFKNIIGVTELNYGGHFLAMQLPEVFSKDVLKAISEFRRFWRRMKDL